MFNVNNIAQGGILGIILPMLQLLYQVSSKRLPNSVFSQSAKAEKCSPEILNSRDILGTPRLGRGKLECVRQCMVDINCELAVYEEFRAGLPTCTKMSAVLSGSSNTFYSSDSRMCRALKINPCLNQGKLYQGVCLCQDGFTGQACEYSNPSSCKTEWNWLAKLVSAKTLRINGVREPDNFSRLTPKLVFRNRELRVDSVMSAMDADFNRSTGYWYVLTFPFLEKTAWNRFADRPRRQFLHFMDSGRYQILSLNATSKTFIQDNYQSDFTFVAPEKIRLSVERQLPNDWQLLADDLSDGYELEAFTWVNVNSEVGVVVSQLSDRLVSLFVNSHFFTPPEVRNMKYVLGIESYKAESRMLSGLINDISRSTARKRCYLNPCWTTVGRGKYSRISLLSAWKSLGAYLRLGKDVRVNIGSTYHQVLEVIQTGDDFALLLAPYASQTDTAAFTSKLYGVRSLVTSRSMFESCSHHIEGDTVTEHDQYQIRQNIVLFVDSRTWKQVFAVFSNSSVAAGSVSDLVSGVLAGSDTRIWIHWLKTDLSRFLDTHMSSVTDDGKVSTESVVTWRPIITTDVILSSRCDLQYILVTSEGRVDILSFNILTPATSEVVYDVKITWFLA